MTSFELNTDDEGRIRAFHKAITTASKKLYFINYTCTEKHRCYINLKALTMPFMSKILNSDKEVAYRNSIWIKCSVEDQVHNQIVFKVGPESELATLTYKLRINDLDDQRKTQLNLINRSIPYARVIMKPHKKKQARFLLSAFNEFSSVINQVTIRASKSEVKFIGSTDPYTTSMNNSIITAEFLHKREDFSQFAVKQDIAVTIPLPKFKIFLNFVENHKEQLFSTYTLEGVGAPAHFVYESDLFRASFVIATSLEYIDEDNILPIEMGNPEESFITDEPCVQGDDYNDILDRNDDSVLDEYEDDESSKSDTSDLLDGNLDGLNANNSIFGGAESIRSEIRGSCASYTAEKIIDWDKDPNDYEDVKIVYSSDSDDSDAGFNTRNQPNTTSTSEEL